MTAHLCLHLLVCVRLLGCKDFLLSLWRWPSDPRPSSCAFTGVSWFCWIFTKTNRVTSLTAPGETLAVNPGYGSTISAWDEEHGAEPRFLCFQEGRHHAGVFSWWEICGYRRGECLSRWWRPGDVEILCAKVSRGWRRLLSKTQRLIYTNNISATLKLSCSAHVLSHFMQIKQFYREYIISHCLHLERICPMETNKVVRIEF